MAAGRGGSWRKFLAKKESLVLPYFGGGRVQTKDRAVRLAERPEALGWYRFEVEGRHARATEPADPELAGLPKVRGHLVGDILFRLGAPPEPVFFLPADEAAMFASCTCYRWHSGEVVFGEVDFESESEESARTAFEERRWLADAKGIAAPLRAAFAYATVRRAGAALGIPCSAREAWPFLSEIADGTRRDVMVGLRSVTATS